MAKALAEKLIQTQNATLNPDLACAGGLVHDIAKGQPHHEEAGFDLLCALNLPILANLVRSHRDLVLPQNEPITERELVYLADKYCHGKDFVPIQTRFAQKQALFSQNPEALAAIKTRKSHALALEARLKAEIAEEPARIAQNICASL
ncbi:MAG: HD domain-containing protein [Desulfovibrio sp.]|nr:HD domain-containing protein [Desulfovibrio sp.]